MIWEWTYELCLEDSGCGKFKRIFSGVTEYNGGDSLGMADIVNCLTTPSLAQIIYR
jgi:hypothetical protein